MLIDDYNLYIDTPTQHTIPTKRLLQGVLKSLENTPNFFFKALNKHRSNSPEIGNLNEDGLTQIFVQQNRIQILKLNLPIYVGSQYIDTFRRIKGIPDIYFTLSE